MAKVILKGLYRGSKMKPSGKVDEFEVIISGNSNEYPKMAMALIKFHEFLEEPLTTEEREKYLDKF